MDGKEEDHPRTGITNSEMAKTLQVHERRPVMDPLRGTEPSTSRNHELLNGEDTTGTRILGWVILPGGLGELG